MAIQGIQYNKAQTEYQYFPEEYFSGADVTIYFGDVWMDDLSGLQFSLEEQLNPIFGYNSYVWDAVGRGQRIVQGTFSIPFKEAGYLHRILAHIGQMEDAARPFLSYALAGQTKPRWVPSYGETFEALLDRAAGGAANTTKTLSTKGLTVQATSNTANWPVMQLGSNNTYVGALKKELAKYGPAKTDIGATLRKGSKGAQVTKLQKRLNEYMVFAKIHSKISEDGNFGTLTETAVKKWQGAFSRTLAKDGIVGPKTAALLNQAMNAASSTFDAPTKYAVMKYQAAMKLTVDGVVGAATKAKLTRSVSVVAPGKTGSSTPVTVTTTNSKAERAFSQYESTVWGNALDDTTKSSGTHFYGTESQSSLLMNGIDIYINYGPLGAAIAGGAKKTVNFNTSIRCIRNVQFSAVGQVLSPTGEPIAEQYSFIARDLD